ncbi:MAG: hypothetical protein JNK05_07575 [Myxococcales bacterium]|nr:hypothetical protein [Myxococcales bacterium]
MKIGPEVAAVLSLLAIGACKRGHAASSLACSADLDVDLPTGAPVATVHATITTVAGANACVAGMDETACAIADANGRATVVARSQQVALRRPRMLTIDCIAGEKSRRTDALVRMRPTLVGIVDEVHTSDAPTARVAIIAGEFRAWGPAGTTVTFEGHTTTLGGGGPTVLPFDVAAAAARMTLSRGSTYQWLPRVDSPTMRLLPVTIARPGGAALTGSIRFSERSIASIAERWLAGITSGPLAGGSPNARGGVVVTARDRGVQLARRVGDTASFDDVAVIGVIRESTRRGACGTYVDARTRARVEIGWTAIDGEVTVYQRATGRALATRSFAAPTPRCASSIRSSPRSTYDDASVEAFVSQSARRL